jgi:hypothetical protein
MGNREFTERRQHERARVQKIVLGILNSDEIVTTGLINDISLGGVNFTHELVLLPTDTSIHSIDLIADSDYMNDIPCEYAWNFKVEKESYFNARYLQQCGIQFGKLDPNQIFMLRSFINRCTSLGTQNISANVRLNFS